MKKSIVKTHPGIAAQWHLIKNGNLTPEEVTYGSDKKVWWLCPEGHQYPATIKKRTRSIRPTGCPYCAGRKVLKGYNDLATKFPEIAAQWHPTKNGNLTPEEVTYGSGKKVWWLCPEGHPYPAFVYSRAGVNKTGCPYCSNTKVLKGYNDLATKFPEIATEWHPTKNGKLTPENITPGSDKKVWWLCPEGHSYESVVASRTGVNKTDCPYCSNTKVLKGYNDLATKFPEIAAEWHPTKNGNLTPEEVTYGSASKVWWLCPENKSHIWKMSVYERTGPARRYCPDCLKGKDTSFMEQAIYFYMKGIKKFGETISRWNELKEELDIYLPELKIGVEHDGYYFHHNKEKKDLKKDIFFKKKNIKVLRVKEIPSNEVLKPDSEYILYYHDNTRHEVIRRLIKAVSRLTGIKVEIDLESFVDVDRDKTIIYNQFITNERKKSLKVKHPEIAAQWHPTKNGDLTPLNVTPGSSIKVWWLCPEGHPYSATVASKTRSKPNSCPYCSSNKILKGFNDLATKYPEIAAEWHPTKNRNLTSEEVMPGSNKKRWWLCPEGHSYESVVASRTTSGTGCSYCSGKKTLKGFNDLATKYPEIAAEWHPTKNENLTPEEVTYGSGKKRFWLCPEGHTYSATVDSRAGMNKTGCPFCKNKSVLKGYNDLAKTHPEVAAKWHPTKNGDVTPEDVIYGSDKKRWFIVNGKEVYKLTRLVR